MIFHVGPFRAGKKDLIELLGRNKNNLELISFYCASSMFPVAAAVVFCMEEFPEHREKLEQRLEVLKEFYGYESVVE